jgi:hypothetical protein
MSTLCVHTHQTHIICRIAVEGKPREEIKGSKVATATLILAINECVTFECTVVQSCLEPFQVVRQVPVHKEELYSHVEYRCISSLKEASYIISKSTSLDIRNAINCIASASCN